MENQTINQAAENIAEEAIKAAKQTAENISDNTQPSPWVRGLKWAGITAGVAAGAALAYWTYSSVFGEKAAQDTAGDVLEGTVNAFFK